MLRLQITVQRLPSIDACTLNIYTHIYCIAPSGVMGAVFEANRLHFMQYSGEIAEPFIFWRCDLRQA